MSDSGRTIGDGDHCDDDYKYKAACSGLRYLNPEPCGEVSEILVDGKWWPVHPKWTDREKAVIAELSASQELTAHQVMRQALRLYQVHVERLNAGETCAWSGDANRAAEFMGRM